MKAYRRRLVGLPLQRSLFARIHQAPALIGVRGVLPADALSAWLDDAGDLYLDEAHVAELARALPLLATPDFLTAMQRALSDSCNAVVEATEQARVRAAQVTADEAGTLLADLGERITALMPFGILSKFVPDALYGAWKREHPDCGPCLPVPARSPGGDLTRAAAVLCVACRAEGYDPTRLRDEWPRVPKAVATLVTAFCHAHAGFGPLAWEATGYEDPEFVCRLLVVMFAAQDPAELLRRIEPRPGAGDVAGRPLPASVLGRALEGWLEFLERETWYVRRAFYVGVVPLLRRLLPVCQRVEPALTASDLLFLTLPELTDRDFAPGCATARRTTYFAEREYIAQHGLSGSRLGMMMGEA